MAKQARLRRIRAAARVPLLERHRLGFTAANKPATARSVCAAQRHQRRTNNRALQRCDFTDRDTPRRSQHIQYMTAYKFAQSRVSGRMAAQQRLDKRQTTRLSRNQRKRSAAEMIVAARTQHNEARAHCAHHNRAAAAAIRRRQTAGNVAAAQWFAPGVAAQRSSQRCRDSDATKHGLSARRPHDSRLRTTSAHRRAKMRSRAPQTRLRTAPTGSASSRTPIKRSILRAHTSPAPCSATLPPPCRSILAYKHAIPGVDAPRVYAKLKSWTHLIKTAAFTDNATPFTDAGAGRRTEERSQRRKNAHSLRRSNKSRH